MLSHLRGDEPRGHRINKDLPTRQFPRQGFCKGIESRFLHRIGNLPGITGMADYARYIDDPPPSLTQHEKPEDPLREVPGTSHDGALFIKLIETHGVNIGID